MTYTIDTPDSPTALLQPDPMTQIRGSAQTPYVWYDPRDDTIGLGTDMHNSGTPIDLYHGLYLRWYLPTTVDAVALADAINDPAGFWQPRLARIAAGYDAKWDGHNTIGTLTDDAADALSELADWCDGGDASAAPLLAGENAGVWDPRDWYSHATVDGLTADTTDEELDAICEREDSYAAAESVVLDGLYDYLRQIRDQLRAEVE